MARPAKASSDPTAQSESSRSPSEGGWTKLPAWLPTDEQMLELSHRKFRLFIYMLTHCWRGGRTATMLPGQVYTSVPEIADDLHMDRSGVYDDIRKMIDKGLLCRIGGKIVVDHGRWTSTGPRTVGETPTQVWAEHPQGVGETPTASGRNAQSPVGETPTGKGVADAPEPLGPRASGPSVGDPSDVESSEYLPADLTDDDVSRACGTADGPSSTSRSFRPDEHGNDHDNDNGGSRHTAEGGGLVPTSTAFDPSAPGPSGAAVPGEVESVVAFLADKGLTPSQAAKHGGSLTLAEARGLFAQIEGQCQVKPGANPVAIVVSILKRGRPEIDAVLRQPGARAAARRVPVGTGTAASDEEMRRGMESNKRLLSEGK